MEQAKTKENRRSWSKAALSQSAFGAASSWPSSRRRWWGEAKAVKEEGGAQLRFVDLCLARRGGEVMKVQVHRGEACLGQAAAEPKEEGGLAHAGRAERKGRVNQK